MNNNQAEASFANGWPDLVVTPNDAHWESFSDYLSRELTVNFTLHNANPAAVAHGVQITGATSTNGVSLATATPVSVGDIAAGGNATVSLVFNVPAGVSNYYTNINGSVDAATLPLNPNPPASPAKLVFIHHSTGENWLTDCDGNLGTTLTANNYFVSDTNYGWGPADADAGSPNPLRGQDAWSGVMTVANAKGIYNDLLPYFAAHQEKLFVVITAPPLQSGDTNASQAANARAVNNWLVNNWLTATATTTSQSSISTMS